MKKLNTFELYELGQYLFKLSLIKETDLIMTHYLDLIIARYSLQQYMDGKSIFPPASRRAAGAVIDAITSLTPAEWSKVGDNKVEFHAHTISSALKNFETVLKNDMPDVATYHVAQKGIFRTEDLIANADHQILEEARNYLPKQAKDDIKEAGKCLAFEITTASAFHMWRAVEAVMCFYLENLTGKPLQDLKVGRNWGEYIKALKENKANKKITEFVDHIRQEYRNPVSHPDESISFTEAFNLFGAGISSINQMIAEIIKLQETPKTATE